MDATKKLQDVVSVDMHAAKGLLSSGHCYLDVRKTEEFNKDHIENALNVPYMYFTQEGKFKNPEFLNQVTVLCKKEDHLVVGCQSGARSHRACVDLLNAGYEHVTEMGGAYSAWVDNGLAQHKPAE
ncbi:protein HIGH ARSENIC CONTENT 1, mitochondrial-like [Pistacia vera]|uniref:protein HIGH ARSENIC CONTENT 1, mitochondrial-like n=1 Tax=Pistacia vera TaxID=55513 RepID=UPI001263423F|nr:protein HIGH ARSENIC CONTENT 1, mitochondrial-like [Pistacia vera]